MNDYYNKYLTMLKNIILSSIDKSKYKVFLFGSRVSGSDKRYSDIDIGILGDKPLGRAYYRIINKIEACDIPYKVDIVDFNLVDKKFKEIALQKVEIWNDPKS